MHPCTLVHAYCEGVNLLMTYVCVHAFVGKVVTL